MATAAWPDKMVVKSTIRLLIGLLCQVCFAAAPSLPIWATQELRRTKV